jgi:polysaccharide deacetylase family protein (PEP-CTERM system associated)
MAAGCCHGEMRRGRRWSVASGVSRFYRLDLPHKAHAPSTASVSSQIVVSFDVEEHFRIEAAAGLQLDPTVKAHYCDRLAPSTQWILNRLDEANVKATFFIVGLLGREHPDLVRAIHHAGHEVASHGWDHQRVLNFTPGSFREDLRRSKDTLEQIIGQPVLGYRAPTFSIMRETAWALDVLAELDFAYDSSIYSVRHDRYGVPSAPRAPYIARGEEHEILELPPATLKLLGINFPMGGGGYFRLFPLFFMEWAIRQAKNACIPPVAMLYFHPWEFDPDQVRLPLGFLNRFRTYVGLNRSRGRLSTLLSRHRFVRAIDAARCLDDRQDMLPRFALQGDGTTREVLTQVDTM